MINPGAEIGQLLDELVAAWTPETLRRLRPVLFRSPERFDDEAACRLLRLRELLGDSRYNACIRELLLNRLEHSANLRAERECAVIAAFRAQLESDFLKVDSEILQVLAGHVPADRLTLEKALFVQEWARRNDLELDSEQAAAIGSVHEHTLVTARAGSGKTRALVARAAFLIKHCQVAPDQMLLLAFNRKAAEEMRERLNKVGCNPPHVMTFHALAHAIVHPEQPLIYDDDNQLALSSAFQHFLNGFMDDEQFRDDVRRLMMLHFRSDWERLTREGLRLSPKECILFRRALPDETLRGEYVKSFGEKAIANFLFEHDIAYQYERNHWWEGRNYRPDFTIQQHRVVIEYFGLAGDPDYDRDSRDKRRYWREQRDWRFIELGRKDIGPDGAALATVLARKLVGYGVACRRLTDEELWLRIRSRAVTRFGKMTTTFIGRCRSASISPDELDRRTAGHRSVAEAEQVFLRLASAVYRAYIARLLSVGEEDFAGLLERAATAVGENGQAEFDRRSGRGEFSRIRFVMIDEYQDFSPLFFRLVQAARRHNARMQVFCVGDDWQAINRFAGSDLQYFEQFDGRFPPSHACRVLTNYRSAPCVVEFGNSLMSGRGSPARSGRDNVGCVQLLDLAQFEPNVRERELCPGVAITPAVRRIIFKVLKDGGGIVLLARRNTLPYSIGTGRTPRLQVCREEWVRGLSDADSGRVTVCTVHKYKVLESDTVVLLDVIERSFPLIHPDWVFMHILGDTVQKLIDDERRLFYVACTRASRRLILLTDSSRVSPFVKGIESHCTQVQWDEYPFASLGTNRWIVKIGNQPGRGAAPTMLVKDQIKGDGFEYFSSSDWKHWASTQSIPEGGVESLVEALRARTWAAAANGLEIRICDQDDGVVALYHVDHGQWLMMWRRDAPATEGDI